MWGKSCGGQKGALEGDLGTRYIYIKMHSFANLFQKRLYEETAYRTSNNVEIKFNTTDIEQNCKYNTPSVHKLESELLNRRQTVNLKKIK